jgi:hypothetical protein
MKSIGLSLAALAVALVFGAAAPQRAAAQDAAPAPGCTNCFIVDNLYECKADTQGGDSCTVSNAGRTCSVSGPCPKVADPAPIDAVANLFSTDLLQDVGTEAAFALVANTENGQQLRAKCNGVVLARAYTAAAAQRLRRETAVIEL